MPVLSLSFGIIVYVQKKADVINYRISMPTIRIMKCCFFDGEILEGSFPARKLKLLLAWLEIHKEDLEANWKLLSEGKEPFKIEPLR